MYSVGRIIFLYLSSLVLKFTSLHWKNCRWHMWSPSYVGPLFGRTCWTCLNPPSVHVYAMGWWHWFRWQRYRWLLMTGEIGGGGRWVAPPTEISIRRWSCCEYSARDFASFPFQIPNRFVGCFFRSSKRLSSHRCKIIRAERSPTHLSHFAELRRVRSRHLTIFSNIL